MKLNIDQNILNFDRTPVETKPAVVNEKGVVTEPAKYLTFRKVIENVLSAQDEMHPMTSEKKLYAYQIGVRLYPMRAEHDLTTDQVAFLKERVGAFYGPVPYGRFLELIGDQAIVANVESEEVTQQVAGPVRKKK